MSAFVCIQCTTPKGLLSKKKWKGLPVDNCGIFML